MPNWCNNTITLSGPKDKIKSIFDKAKADNAFIQQLYPMPEALEGTTSPAPKEGKVQPLVDGHDNWYDWRVENWGTKWDVDVEGLEYDEHGDSSATIFGWFDSAWAPPINAYEHFLIQNEDCSISAMYYEGGMDFAGKWEDFADMTVTPGDFTADEMEDPNSGLIYDINEQFNMSEFVREWEEEQQTETEKFIVGKEAVNV
jgi:hypothetical protein